VPLGKLRMFSFLLNAKSSKPTEMSSKILLLSANRYQFPDPVFPIGLSCINSALVKAGHRTLILDINLDSREKINQAIDGFAPDFIGISLRNIDDVLIRNKETPFGDTILLCNQIRQKTRCPIVIGGAGYSIFPKQLLEMTKADYGICGEGEQSIVKLIQSLEEKQSPHSVPGLVFRQSEKIVMIPPQRQSAIPSEFLLQRPERLTSFYLGSGGMLNIQTQRGCSLRCCFCTYPLIEGRMHRFRAPEDVAEEMATLQTMGAKYVFVVDSVFNSDEKHVTGICEAIKRRGLNLPWGCFLRPAGLTPSLMKLMADAGLKHVEFGSESFSNAVLKQYGKGLCFQDIQRASELAHSENIDYCHFMICGGPGETMDTLEESFENSLSLPNPVILGVVGMRIYPGTPLYTRSIAEGQLSETEDLLAPHYYLAPGLTSERVFEKLNSFVARSPSWLPGDMNPAYANLVSKLRKRGVMGPLWSYFAMMQRVWPQTN